MSENPFEQKDDAVATMATVAGLTEPNDLEQFTDDARLVDLGIGDSELFDLIEAFEDQFDITLPSDFNPQTVGETMEILGNTISEMATEIEKATTKDDGVKK